MVNELRGGWQWSPNDFFANVTPDQFAEQDGFALSFAQVNNAAFITGPTATNNPAPRNTTTWSIDNTLNWLRGAHSLSMGGGYAGVFNRRNSYNAVTPITLGFDTNTDPANGLFNATNFPSATANQLNEARALYAILTGRVTVDSGNRPSRFRHGQVRVSRRPGAQVASNRASARSSPISGARRRP